MGGSIRTRERIAAALAIALLTGACGVGSGAGSGPAPRAAVRAFVRVNQVGYAVGGPQRANLLGGEGGGGTAFRVTDASGATGEQGVVGADLGAWSRRFPHVYAIDLAIAAPGTYAVHVDAATPADSPPFAVGEPRD